MESEDVLREQVPDGRPVPVAQVLAGSRVRQRAEVVDERVGPDVGDLIRIPRDRHPPRLTGARDREVLETAGDEASRLVVPKPRPDEVGPRVVERRAAVLVRGEAEEPVLLLDPLGLDAVDRALAVDELGLGLERLAADAVPARRRRPGRCRRPLSRMRWRNSWTKPLCPSSLVLMKKSGDAFTARRQLPPGAGDLVGVLLRRRALAPPRRARPWTHARRRP